MRFGKKIQLKCKWISRRSGRKEWGRKNEENVAENLQHMKDTKLQILYSVWIKME